MLLRRRFEYAEQRTTRACNKKVYRLMHWPLWVLVFFLAPPPLTLELFAGRAGSWSLVWFGVVLLGTGAAAKAGWLPGSEPVPYIMRFTEDRPNPLPRRICYGVAWNVAISFAAMNLVCLIAAVSTGRWHLVEVYRSMSIPVLSVVVLLAWAGMLPRVRPTTAGEGRDRRYFYGAVWSVTVAQTVLLLLCLATPPTHRFNQAKLVIYVATLAGVAILATRGTLPRTRQIVASEPEKDDENFLARAG